MEATWDFWVNVAMAVLTVALSLYFYFLGQPPATASSGAASSAADRGTAAATAATTGQRAAVASSGTTGTSARSEEAQKEKERVAIRAAIAATKSDTCYRGVVKRFSDRNGMGFILCNQTLEKYNVDVRIYRSEYEAAGLHVGAGVSFHTVLGGQPACPNGHPWATALTKLSEEETISLAAENADSAATRSSREREKPEREKQLESSSSKGRSKGKGKGGKSSRGFRGDRGSPREDDEDADEAASDFKQSRRSLKADAPEFVPKARTADDASPGSPGTALKAGAAAFVPGAVAGSIGRLDAGAPEFVPGSFALNPSFLQ